MPEVHVGSPPKEWDSWEDHLVHFHHFKRISTEDYYSVKSPLFSCCNREWRLELCPGGDRSSPEGMVALFLQKCSGNEISAQFAFLIKNTRGKIVFEETTSPDYETFPNGEVRGWGDFVEYEELLDPSKKVLNNGTLTVEVRIKPHDKYCCANFIPKNEFAQNMMQSFMDETTADVIFEVKHDNDEADAQGDYDPSSPTAKNVLFYAHKIVLQFCAKGSSLASLCEGQDTSSSTTTPVVPISDIHPEIFHQMLQYVYGGEIAAAEWETRSKDFIDAADRYGVTNLKIEAEAWYVKHFEMTVENVIDTLLYADDARCFLLKEVCTKFILENVKEVIASDSFESITQSTSVMREILSLASMNKKKQGDGKKKGIEDLNKLSINELRAKLYDRGEEFDGPRETLIALLEPRTGEEFE
mmetsp:Transcript_10007/g.18315  ORF Transcript_10007/g.18315 Transcript_10007/m.18315 type:complete len:414 (-) Transcript_10007:164-1405(-)|eukprot:CAMPEP_0196136786 /NCGR_PEP_ID=MMETSP0910-20130528/4975_1 /TAXON_ID=49265 /ORGANISM="Thalassiosira rotula, Strain GSO102" /LENGTH=413 /DNA_ID=CAMNT_0041397125 /DNA_START=109 /DNA_END=1350 /DNA_ORIENTATION=-